MTWLRDEVKEKNRGLIINKKIVFDFYFVYNGN